MSQPAKRAGGLALIAGGIGLCYGIVNWEAPRDFIDGRGNALAHTQTIHKNFTASKSAIDVDALYEDARVAFETAELPNGLKIVVVEDHRAPVVTHMVWYNVGAADEDPGLSGLAHFLEHLMFKGTKSHKAGEFSDIIAAAGGQENAFTSQDYTGYFQKIAKQHLPTMMQFEADRMANLAFIPEEVLPEHDVVIEERRQRTDNNPTAQFNEQMNAALYGDHPYGVPVIGWPDELRNLTPEAALEFYSRHYGPDNATLIVAGDTNLEEVAALATQTYGKLSGIGVKPRNRGPKPTAPDQTAVEFESARLAQERVVLNWLAPTYHGADADTVNPYALSLLSDILGGGGTSRLYQSLVVEQKRSPSVGAWYSGVNYDIGEFGIAVLAEPDQALDGLKQAALVQLSSIAEKGVSDEELQRAKLNNLVGQIYAKDSVGHLARMIGVSLTSGLDYDQIRSWPDEMRAVSRADVQNAARWLLGQPYLTGFARIADGDVQ